MNLRKRNILFGTLLVAAQANAGNPKETIMTSAHANGSFDVTLNLLQPYNTSDPSFGRRSLDKVFHGDLDAGSQGEMLSVGTARDNGGYVAIERVTGTLHGRQGSFALQHNATMTAGVPNMEIKVVPGSGSGELVGLSGRMKIIIAPGGAHSYEFDYELGAK